MSKMNVRKKDQKKSGNAKARASAPFGVPNISNITRELEALQARQEAVFSTSSRVIRLAGQMITAMHNKDYTLAKSLKRAIEKEMGNLSRVEKGFEYYSMQAHQEYVEAIALFTVLTSSNLPDAKSLNENSIPYLLGIMDLVGELKREAIDELRSGDEKGASAHYEIMKGIYDSTLHMRFANALLPNFRKKQDVARIQLESIAAELFHSYNGKVEKA
ncbi:MAG: hypothetical protein ACP5RF_00070 [Candidatus Micrarchaeia archaeon]